MRGGGWRRLALPGRATRGNPRRYPQFGRNVRQLHHVDGDGQSRLQTTRLFAAIGDELSKLEHKRQFNWNARLTSVLRKVRWQENLCRYFVSSVSPSPSISATTRRGVPRLDCARSKLGARMFEPKVFWEKMYCVGESKCGIVGTFPAHPSGSAPGALCPACYAPGYTQCLRCPRPSGKASKLDFAEVARPFRRFSVCRLRQSSETLVFENA